MRLLLPLLAAALCACAAQSLSVSRDYDPAAARRVHVKPFTDYSRGPGSGEMAARAFEAALTAAGWEVVPSSAASSVLSGHVTDLDEPAPSTIKVAVLDNSRRSVNGMREVDQPYVYPGKIAVSVKLAGASGAKPLWSASDSVEAAVLKDGARLLADRILKAVAEKRRKR